MSASIGTPELALDATPSPEPHERFGRVRTRPRELLQLSSQMPDVPKIDEGRLAIAREHCFVSDIAAGVAQSMSARALKKGLYLSVDIHPDIAVMTVGDGFRLRHLLARLTSNVVKRTHAGGVIISARLAKREVQSAEVHFTVSDAGVGIPSEALGRVFDPFYQGEDSNRRSSGTARGGLGVCRSLVQLMGGRLWVESRLGAGRAFHVVLPFCGAQEPAPSRRLSDAGLAGHTAVIVSPESGLRAGIACVLRSLTCDVHVADEAAGGHRDIWPRATIVVLDASLGLSSVQELAAVFARRGGDKPPVLFVAAAATAAERAVASAVRGAHVMPKPVARRSYDNVAAGV